MYEITEEKIAAFKAKHGDVFLITVEDKQAVFRKPKRKDISFATAASSQGKDPMMFTESILRNTYIEGDMDIIENDDYFLAAMPMTNEMVETKQAEIRKL